jgi:hypothetical protein
MKYLALFSLIAALSAVNGLAVEPKGTLLELHSCELYAGGCTVSSEATLDGRYMLRAWNFTGGTFSGVDLTGLQLAILQSASQNLAAEDTISDRAVVYLPNSANTAQRKALLSWVKATLPELKNTELLSRAVPIKFERTTEGYSFSAGKTVSVSTASLESCDRGGCGEALWYAPRTTSTVYTVAVNRASRINEPVLQLTWNEGGRRSVFLAKFGETKGEPKNFYVSATDLCGPGEQLF